jgi:hypothetical protein
MHNALKEPTLRELARAGAIDALCLAARGAGFAVHATYGQGEHVLTTARGEPRLFASLNTAATFLLGLGIDRFQVDAAGYEPGPVRKARPDRAEALRNTRTTPKQRPLNF